MEQLGQNKRNARNWLCGTATEKVGSFFVGEASKNIYYNKLAGRRVLRDRWRKSSNYRNGMSGMTAGLHYRDPLGVTEEGIEGEGGHSEEGGGSNTVRPKGTPGAAQAGLPAPGSAQFGFVSGNLYNTTERADKALFFLRKQNQRGRAHVPLLNSRIRLIKMTDGRHVAKKVS